MRRVIQQIGWSQESKLLYNVLRQFERLTGVVGKNITTTTTTTTANLNPLLRVDPPSPNTFDILEWTNVTGTNGDFTIEWLMYMYTNAGSKTIYSIGQQNTVYIDSSGVMFLVFNGSVQGAYPLSALPGPYLNTWLHVAVTRYKGLIKVYITSSTWLAQEVINGTDASAIPTNGNDFYIGSENAPNTYYNGLISNFMFTNNYNIYYSSLPTFPIIPLTPIFETILLIGQGTDLTLQLTDQTGINATTSANLIYNAVSGISGDTNGSLEFIPV